MARESKSFWATLPGVLTGIASVLTAVTGLYLAITTHGVNREKMATPTVGVEKANPVIPSKTNGIAPVSPPARAPQAAAIPSGRIIPPGQSDTGQGGTAMLRPVPDQEQKRRSAEALVSRFVPAFLAGREELFLPMVSLPFFLDQNMILTLGDLRHHFDDIKTRRAGSWKEFRVTGSRTMTVGDFRARYGDRAREDGAIRALSLGDDDCLANVTVAYNQDGRLQRGSLRVFVRTAGQHPGIAGLWD